MVSELSWIVGHPTGIIELLGVEKKTHILEQCRNIMHFCCQKSLRCCRWLQCSHLCISQHGHKLTSGIWAIRAMKSPTCSVAQSCLTLCDPMDCSMPGFSSPRYCSNSCPFSQWCHSAISSSVVPFCSCLQSFPASGSFQMSQFFTSGDQSIGVSASTSVLPKNSWGWSPLGLTGLISLQAKGLSRVSSNTSWRKASIL